MFSFTYHCDNGLDGVGGGLFPAGLLDEAGAEVLDVERHALYHGFAHRRPVFRQLWNGGVDFAYETYMLSILKQCTNCKNK